MFDPKLPGSWLVDLSQSIRAVRADAPAPARSRRRASRPQGPAWYATPTVAYAVELGYDVAPVEAYVRHENGRYLDAWYNRLRDAYLATMADLGVDAGPGPGSDFLAAMDGYQQPRPGAGRRASADQGDGQGRHRQAARAPAAARAGGRASRGPPWPARRGAPTSAPRSSPAPASTCTARCVKHAAFTGQYPVAILSDCAVYAADGPSPLDFLPYQDGKPLPGGFRLGVNPGLVKHEGTQTVLWGEDVRERFDAPELNLARYIKDGTVTDADNGE